jgi:multicomponent Na+:H+ antiporter subunit A
LNLLPLSALLLVTALAAPVTMLLACLWRSPREQMHNLLWLAPIPALLASLLAVGGPPLILNHPPYRVALLLDLPGAMLLGVAALLWIVAGFYASSYLRGNSHGARFAICWLLTLTGSVGAFMSFDLASFYLAFALVSIPAYGLIVHDGTTGVQRAGSIYMALTILGETFLLMAFVLLAAGSPGGSLLIRDAMAALPTSPWRDPALALLISGFGLKAGLVPLHVWMPLTYSAASTPAAAVLSGAVVKAGVIGLIRFLPFSTAMPDWGGALAGIGLLTAFYGVAVGITQTNPRTVLAYSSVSQMGLIAAVCGLGLAKGDEGVVIGAAFYAAHHVLVKGALFLAVGVVATTGSRRLSQVLVLAGVLGLGLGGLPLTGGALAKLAVKPTMGEGMIGFLGTLSAIGTALLMLHFLHRLTLTARPDSEAAAPRGLVLPWLTMAIASVAIPWVLYPAAGVGKLSDALAPAALWAALWPILIGGILAFGLRRWEDRLPRVPEGDLVVMVESAARKSVEWGAMLERAENITRQWPIACLALLAIALLLGAAMLAGR